MFIINISFQMQLRETGSKTELLLDINPGSLHTTMWYGKAASCVNGTSTYFKRAVSI